MYKCACMKTAYIQEKKWAEMDIHGQWIKKCFKL